MLVITDVWCVCVQGKARAEEKQTIGTSLSSSSPAPNPAAEEVEASGEDSYPHLLPKVQVPFTTKPGETPRRVLIQRWGCCADLMHRTGCCCCA
jgi:hypothetical protein